MIKKGTLINITDNSGAKVARCIGILRNKKSASVGDLIVVAIQSADTGEGIKIKKGDVCKVVMVRTKYEIQRKDGVVVRFGDNAGVLVNAQGDLVATAVFGPLPVELRECGLQRALSLGEVSV